MHKESILSCIPQNIIEVLTEEIGILIRIGNELVSVLSRFSSDIPRRSSFFYKKITPQLPATESPREVIWMTSKQARELAEQNFIKRIKELDAQFGKK